MITPSEELISAIEKALKDMIITGTVVILVEKEGVSYVVHEDKIEQNNEHEVKE